MEMNFCRRCGKPLEHIQDHVYKCADDHTIFANQSPAVGIFFVSADNQKVLLSTRGIEPHKGMLDALGGFLDANETFEEGAARELREELDLEPEDYEPLTYLTSGYDSYPYQSDNVPFVSVLFYTKLRNKKTLRPADDVAAVDWYSLETVALDQLHADDIREGVRELQRILRKEE